MKRADLSSFGVLAMALMLASCTGPSGVGTESDSGIEVADSGVGAGDGGGGSDGGNATDDGGASNDGGLRDDAGPGMDSGSVDSGEVDGGRVDSGVADSGVMDSGEVDAGLVDGGAVDGGAVDGGAVDGGGTQVAVALTVSTEAEKRAISPLIYGINPGKATCSNGTAKFGMCRLGGNPWTTFNWENNASNEEVIVKENGVEVARCYPNSAQLGAGNDPAAPVTSLIAEAAGNSAAAVVTIPIIDHVAADKLGGGCPGDVQFSGSNYMTTRFKTNQPRKNATLSDPPDTADDVVSQDEFVQFIKSRAGTSQVLFTLDNQPELWSQTQVRVHPDHATYEEVVSRNVTYATMLRDNWPGAEITGYGGYGYLAFLNLQWAPNPPGNMVFLDYYLGAMNTASTTAGKRLIDYLDIHWYTEVKGGGQSVLFNDGTEAIAAARVQAPRSLWDSTYTEPSWIGDNVGPIRLVPWIEAKIATYYPDTKLAISAWAYGGEGSISGAIAVADALGIYGRSGVGLAALDPAAADVSFALGGFAVFRNYDGAGAAFGDTSVRATTSDVERVSVYASTDTQVSGRVVIVAINRSTEALTTSLSVESSSSFTAADVYRLTSSAAIPVASDPLSATAANLFITTLPPYSVSVIVPKN